VQLEIWIRHLIAARLIGIWLTPDLFRLRRVTWKSTPSNQGCLLLVWFLLRRNTLTKATLRGPAAIRHPWRGAALAASMPLDPLHVACVQPAPKSRFVSSGLARMKIKIKSQSERSSPSRPNSCGRRRRSRRQRGGGSARRYLLRYRFAAVAQLQQLPQGSVCSWKSGYAT
jgi:hypothetical protein